LRIPYFSKNLAILVVIWIANLLCDRIWLSLDHSIPGWDEADYLTGTLNYWKALQRPQWDNSEWWQSLWLLSSKIPPLTYIASGEIQGLFGTGHDQALLVMLLFNAVLIGSVYGLGKILFSETIGLWAAALCQVLPGVYRLRIEFLLDYPLATAVTFSFFCLTAWITNQKSPNFRFSLQSWFFAALFGISLGLALLVKQTAILFLVIPILWVGFGTIWERKFIKLVQLIAGLWVSSCIFAPWYRTNWLTVLTSGKRATIDAAIAEGDAPLNTIAAWTFYWQQLPHQVTLPLLLVPIFSLLLYWGKGEGGRGKGKGERERGKSTSLNILNSPLLTPNSLFPTPNSPLPSLKWLAIFVIGGYLLSSLNMNKDDRYTIPYLPVLAVFLAYGLTVFNSLLGKRIRWGTFGISILLMVFNLFPVGGYPGDWMTFVLSPSVKNHPQFHSTSTHKEIIAQIIRTEPYLRSTLGVLPSTAVINQHNLNYNGALANFQVYGRQVGTKQSNVVRDMRSLSWFLTKTGNQGSVPPAQAQIVQAVETSPEFKLHQTWQLDGDTLKLYHRKRPPVEVISRPLEYSSLNLIAENLDNSQLDVISVGGKVISAKSNFPTPVTLTKVTIPAKNPPGVPVPVSYTWSGTWEELKNGLVLLTWKKINSEPSSNKQSFWIHDHGFGMGNLVSSSKKPEGTFQLIEHTAMLPPADIAPGNYTLEATYLSRTGETYAIKVPNITTSIDSQFFATPAPELDLLTQFRLLAASLPQGTKAVERIFAEIARINQYDPTQDYLVQTRYAAEYRLLRSSAAELAYTVALSNVLQRRVESAIASLEKVTQLDGQNPYAWAYLAFVRLYNWQPKAAEAALTTALDISPNQPQIKALAGIAALMQGNLVKAWQDLVP
jgi:4-amino-4-deoxy-L-arabinose transferase-like glycosyltransferase